MAKRRFDTIIKNGTIIDGTRFPRFVSDIGIVDGKIAYIGKLASENATEVIDADGLVVAPGFIDLHTHYDAQIFWDPYCSNSGENGVTTVVTGNCGFGFAPCRPADRDRYMLMMENTEQVPTKQLKLALPWTWETFPEWLDVLRSVPKGINLLMFLPINPLMIYVMGVDAAKSRRPTASELADMKKLIHEAMDAGACGIGLSHLGESNSHTDFDGTPMPTDTMHVDDAAELASVLKERDEGFIQCLPQLGFTRDFEFGERLAEASSRPVVVNVIGPTTLAPEMHLPQMEWLEEMRGKGLQIFGQGFLHRAWSEFNLFEPNINDHIPIWRDLSCTDTVEERLLKIARPDYRQKMIDAYDPVVMAIGSGPLEVIRPARLNDHPKAEMYESMTLGDIAEAEGKHVVEVMLDIWLETKGEADMRTPAPSGNDPQLMGTALNHPLVLAGTSDGGAHSKFYCGGHWPTEHIAWLQRESKITTLEDLHAKMSMEPARVAGMTDRGTLEVGKKADIVVYNYDALELSPAPYSLRHDLPGGDWRRYRETSGYRYILVNGVLTHRDGTPTGKHPGGFISVGRAARDERLLVAAE
ncbi:MAG: amidohydrolase family protein [Parvibaculaceae bacterium]